MNKPKYITKECKHHGQAKYVLEPSRNAYRCTKCRSDAVQRRRDKLKIMAIEYMGGKCCKCGYDKCVAALEFHHMDESQKEFGIAYKGYTRSWEKVRVELDKCMLVCSNCHREIHYKLDQERKVNKDG